MIAFLHADEAGHADADAGEPVGAVFFAESRDGGDDIDSTASRPSAKFVASGDLVEHPPERSIAAARRLVPPRSSPMV